jgi:chemotaxis protein MotB
MARRRGGGHGGGHGWFVTFADLMALLMSFFVMLTAFSTQDQKKLQLVAGSMRDAFGVTRESRYSGVIETDGLPVRPHLKHVERTDPSRASDITAPKDTAAREGLARAMAERRFALAATTLRQAFGEMPEIAEISRNLMVEATREGLAISLVDQEGRAMFAPGARVPYERARLALETIAPMLARLPNRIAITGHASAPRAGEIGGAAAWEITAGRALAIRDILAAGGVAHARFHSVAGRADTDPAYPDTPTLAANRRVTILLMDEAPPLPPDGTL